MSYLTLPTPITDLDIAHTVTCGQSFRWRRDSEGFWSCLLPVMGPDSTRDDILVRLRPEETAISYETRPLPTSPIAANDTAVIVDYFRLNVSLTELSQSFNAVDPHIAPALLNFPGLRVTRQDPVEGLFSFLCTSAAPLHRIRKSVMGLCERYGDLFPGGPVGGLRHFSFPSVEQLARAEVADMMALGLGYRARFVQGAARAVLERGGAAWLARLRAMPYEDAKAALVALPGVGEKTADCVCLFALDKDEAIPVDTHIRKIACRNYIDLGDRTLTSAVYKQIGDALRDRFGPMAGWAQQYLFYQNIYEQGAWGAYIEKVVGTPGI